jgi:hypothetical protein
MSKAFAMGISPSVFNLVNALHTAYFFGDQSASVKVGLGHAFGQETAS